MKMRFKLVLLISSLIVLSASNSENDSATCDSNEENCEQFSFERFQRNSSNVSTSSEQKKIGLDLNAVENRMLFDKMQIKEDGNYPLRRLNSK